LVSRVKQRRTRAERRPDQNYVDQNRAAAAAAAAAAEDDASA
jgi:hypothetical protein